MQSWQPTKEKLEDELRKQEKDNQMMELIMQQYLKEIERIKNR